MMSKYWLFAIVILISISNYIFVVNYFQKYTLTNQLLDKRLKCMQYGDTKMSNECITYSHEYIVFILERAIYMNKYIISNIIYMCIILVYKLI